MILALTVLELLPSTVSATADFAAPGQRRSQPNIALIQADETALRSGKQDFGVCHACKFRPQAAAAARAALTLVLSYRRLKANDIKFSLKALKGRDLIASDNATGKQAEKFPSPERA